jgi:hypothetical protein
MTKVGNFIFLTMIDMGNLDANFEGCIWLYLITADLEGYFMLCFILGEGCNLIFDFGCYFNFCNGRSMDVRYFRSIFDPMHIIISGD